MARPHIAASWLARTSPLRASARTSTLRGSALTIELTDVTRRDARNGFRYTSSAAPYGRSVLSNSRSMRLYSSMHESALMNPCESSG